ncbi:lamin tail domain-containing protein, partial [Mycolicibacterium porcinum]
YLERALINPTGPDPGHEAVVIGNCATTSVSLHGWRLVDRNGRESKLDADLAGGASAVIVLDGSGAQLGNSGGNLLLVDDRGTQVDSVTYSQGDAGTEDRYVRFQR